MNERTINEQYDNIVSLLKQKRLKEAQIQLEAYLAQCNNWELQQKLEEAKTAYHYLLQYMQQGADDPQRQELYRQLLVQTWEIAEQSHLLLLDNVSSRYYHDLRRTYKHMQADYRMTDLLKKLEAYPDDLAVCRLMPDNKQNLYTILSQHEEINRNLFLSTWCNSQWSTEDYNGAQTFLQSQQLPENDLCLLTSAVTMSLQNRFDCNKLYWLMNAWQHPNNMVNQRALVGIALTLMAYPDRTSLYPELAERFALLDENGRLGKELNRIYIQLLHSQETEKIDKKMREEIIPGMMKNVNLMREMKFGFEENGDENDLNPDWEKAFQSTELNKMIREMSELQMEGADVYMSSFAQLKNYPFFNELPNWFYPFDMTHSFIVRQFGLAPGKEHSLTSLILQTGFFCNSDKYSLCFTLAHMPKPQQDIILGQLPTDELNEIMEKDGQNNLLAYANRPEVISNLYIHDLYRFCKLYPRRKEFRDFFREEIVLHNIPVLQDILHKAEYMKGVADFLFRKQRYSEALEIYNDLTVANQADANIFQKTGYCQQKEKRYQQAINAYRKADLLKPDHLWTLRHLATCYRHTHDYTTALEYYRKAQAIEPDNTSITYYTAICLVNLEQYDEALNLFFKLDFMEENCLKAWRAIGWCSFVCGKTEQAMRYYDRLLEHTPTATDYLNAGHVAFVLRDLSRAVELYGKAQTIAGSHRAFLEMFDKDHDILLKQGIRPEELPLISDMIV